MFSPAGMTKPTSLEYLVIFTVISLALIAFGVVACVIGFRAPAEKHDLAIALQHRGYWSIGLGIFIAVAYFLFRLIVRVESRR